MIAAVKIIILMILLLAGWIVVGALTAPAPLPSPLPSIPYGRQQAP